jgi:hypothetical protein
MKVTPSRIASTIVIADPVSVGVGNTSQSAEIPGGFVSEKKSTSATCTLRSWKPDPADHAGVAAAPESANSC